MSFAELGVAPDLVAALAKQGITVPTEIQRQALPVLAAGTDAYLNAETGTGKTLAYLLPIVARLDLAQAATQAVILAPTHELAIQIHRQCCDLAQNSGRAMRSLLLIGGTSMERQLDKLKAKPHLVVGSPGRIRDLMTMGKLKVQAVRTVVVDEADRMLLAEGLPEVRAIIAGVPKAHQMVFASATEQPESAKAIAMLAPGVVMLTPGPEAVNPDIAHFYLVCEQRDKPRVLRSLLHALQPQRALVFAHQNDGAARVAAQLAHHNVSVAEMHAGLDKHARKRSMDAFRGGAIPVMVSSDVASRGLDIPGITLVINLDVPSQSKAYLHRVGRTGRAGSRGEAVSLVTEDETRLIRRYQGELGITLRRIRLREGQVILVPEEPSRD
jgi:ATP-dependent RNA helicase DeaD